MSMINHKNKTFSEDVVKEMLSQPIVTTLQDVVVESVNKKLEEESVRLAKAVCEYEEIVHNLEQDLHKTMHERDTYKTMYQDILERFNSLVDEYNELVDEYNSLI